MAQFESINGTAKEAITIIFSIFIPITFHFLILLLFVFLISIFKAVYIPEKTQMKRTMKRKTLLPLLLFLIFPVKFFVLIEAQDIQSGAIEPPAPLFQSDDPLYLTLSMDISAVFENREAKEIHPAELSFTGSEGDNITLPVSVQVRGHFRKDPNNCDFPPIRLIFSETARTNTLFDGYDKIKVVTHCRSRLELYEQNVLKEYLAYKLYNLFAEESYLVRLVHFTYADVKGKYDTLQKMAFFLEPSQHMARRNGCERLDITNIHQTNTNPQKTRVMAVFQYLIGNTDWSVWVQHNTVLLSGKSSPLPIVVPYDFDWSGLVNPPYAVPAEFLPIETVRTRLYRGFCIADSALQPALDEFRQRKEKIYQTCKSVPLLSEKELKKTLKYIDDFYKIVENPKKVESEFHRKCRTLEQGS